MHERYIKDVYDQIISYNSKMDYNAIPHSDTFNKSIIATYGIDESLLKKILSLLAESHKIFIMEIVKEDKNREIAQIDGYVDANVHTIRRLQDHFQMALIEAYAKEFKKRLDYNQIVKFFNPLMHVYNNTPIGILLAKATMLNEFELQIRKKLIEYSEDYKSWKLSELLKNQRNETASNHNTREKIPTATADQQRRAIDSPEYRQFILQSKNLPVQKIIELHGINFFLRVNLRKYNFLYLKKLIDAKEILKKSDVYMLHEMIKIVKANHGRDALLEKYDEDILKLENAVKEMIFLY